MTVIAAFKDCLKISQTRTGLIFAFGLPLLFCLVWLTGYHGATDRLDQLRIGIVNEDGAAGQTIEQALSKNVPYQIETYTSLSEGQQQMNEGAVGMIISIPENFTADVDKGQGTLNYYISQANADIAVSILEGSAEEISSSIGIELFNDTRQELVKTDVSITNSISNFAVSMLPMILGFVTYIAVMTMNIQLNLSSMMLKRNYGKWQIFWARQLLLLAVSVLAPLLITGTAMLFVDPAASFGKMWGFHTLVYIACICLTQMSFALFGARGALINTALVPFQLMTAGSIIPAAMLTPLYRHIGEFLPASNAIQGYLRLIYSGASIGSAALHLLIIAIVAWGVTVVRTAMGRPQPQPFARPA